MSGRRKKHNYYGKKKYANPFFQNRKAKRIHPLASKHSWRLKLVMAAAITFIFGLAWFFYFSPFFIIENISVNGHKKISIKEIEDLVWKQTKHRRFLLGTQKNLNLFNQNKLAETLNEYYSFNNLKITKKLPSTLLIDMREKEYSIVWHEADKYYYSDTGGNIIAEADPLEIKQKKYPLIDNGGDIMIFDKKIEGGGEKIEFIIKLFSEFKNAKHGFELERFIVEPDNNLIKMAVIDGPKIHFNIKEDADKQITKLLVMIREKLKDDFQNKEYINVGIGDKVYYR